MNRRIAARLRGAWIEAARILALGVVACIVTGPVGSAQAASSSSVTRTVPVTTSRGDFDMVVYPPSPAGNAAAEDSKPIILVASGEGGWRTFDDLISGMLAAQGYWVGGFDAMKYFWTAQDDRQVLSADLREFAAALARAAGRSMEAPVVLGGYSFGADLSPWVAGAGGWAGRLRGLLMVSPDETGSLLFRITEMIGFHPKQHVFSVAEALKSAAGHPVVLIHGEKDSLSAAPKLVAAASEPKRLIIVPGATHHFGGREEPLRAALLEGMNWLLKQPAGGEPAGGSRPVGGPAGESRPGGDPPGQGP